MRWDVDWRTHVERTLRLLLPVVTLTEPGLIGNAWRRCRWNLGIATFVLLPRETVQGIPNPGVDRLRLRVRPNAETSRVLGRCLQYLLRRHIAQWRRRLFCDSLTSLADTACALLARRGILLPLLAKRVVEASMVATEAELPLRPCESSVVVCVQPEALASARRQACAWSQVAEVAAPAR